MFTSPKVGRDNEARILRNVVLPAPFGPSSATNSPGWTSKSTPRRTIFNPKRLTSFLTVIMLDFVGATRLDLFSTTNDHGGPSLKFYTFSFKISFNSARRF